mmetsp:Transcript_36787/g.108478  ORF Transcript_36787/g.108478 Transcript_36787/m.108478 type:complete len:116 (-) Transcript_36787:143-490(-)
MQSISSMRTSAFGGASVRATPAARTGLAYKSPVAASVQDLQGTVVSTAMNKSIIVSVERLAPHDKYFKRVRITKRYTAHNDDSSINIGDYVRLEGTRPMSKTKRFAVAEVIRKAN